MLAMTGLSSQVTAILHIKKYFQNELRIILWYLRFKTPDQVEGNKLANGLKLLKQKIPY